MKTLSKNLVGTWELISIDGKPLKAAAQKKMETLHAEVLGMETKIVLASDSTLFCDGLSTLRTLVETSPPVYIRSQIHKTVKGHYVVSGSTIELICSDDNVRLTIHTSWETPGNPKLKQGFEQSPRTEEIRQTLEAGIKQGFQKNPGNLALGFGTYSFDLEDDRLTLIAGIKYVLKRKR